MTRSLSLAQARRVAIVAQGLDRQRPDTVTLRHISDTVKRLGVVQIDSVNVLTRAHLLPLFARLGPYDTALVDRASGRAPRRIIETWAHEASYVPAATFPLLTWNRRGWGRMDIERFKHAQPGLLDRVHSVVADHGPLTSRDIQAHLDPEHSHRPRHHWGWSWTPAKTAMEILFDTAKLTPARRNAQFERVYDLTERVLPPSVRAQPPMEREAAITELIRIAARAHGLGTVRCFADYFRLKHDEARRAIAQLETTGELVPVTVTGWDRPVWMHIAARVPRQVHARALLAPFDPLVFERRRVFELFGMHYRLEIYTPAPKRVYGYYVLPFLLGEHLVARIDLKYDRARGALVVASAYAEQPGPQDMNSIRPDQPTVVHELCAELHLMAQWLGANDVVLADDAHGDLVMPLNAALG